MSEAILPVAFATAFLLDLLWICVNVTGLGEVAGEVVLGSGSAVSKTAVVTIVVFFGAGH